MRTNRRRMTLFVLTIGLLLMGCAAPTPQTIFRATDLNPKLESGQYSAKITDFVIILDASQSMGELYLGTQKLGIAKDIVSRMNRTIPFMKVNGALRTFGHSAGFSKKQTLMTYGPKSYSQAALGKTIDGIGPAGGTSPLHAALAAAGEDLKAAVGRVTIIIVSDGKDMGQSPQTAATNLRQAFGDKLCLYTVQVGDDAGGRQLLEKLATDGGCGEAVNADNIAFGPAMGAFVESVFIAEAPDGDGDGVPDALDKCPDTPKGVKVDTTGCPFDSDADGVPDFLDKCTDTAKGVEVDKWGCPLDSDGDGVADYNDNCPETLKGATVNEVGCWILGRILFDYDKAVIQTPFFQELDAALRVMNQNPGVKIEIQGHTDNKGSAKYNQGLSERRAQAVVDYFLQKGIDPNRLSAKGYGLSRPIASNGTDEGRAMNRRVQLEPLY